MCSVSQSCPTLCDPVDCSPLWVPRQERWSWIIISSFREETQGSNPHLRVSCTSRQILYHWAMWGNLSHDYTVILCKNMVPKMYPLKASNCLPQYYSSSRPSSDPLLEAQWSLLPLKHLCPLVHLCLKYVLKYILYLLPWCCLMTAPGKQLVDIWVPIMGCQQLSRFLFLSHLETE